MVKEYPMLPTIGVSGTWASLRPITVDSSANCRARLLGSRAAIRISVRWQDATTLREVREFTRITVSTSVLRYMLHLILPAGMDPSEWFDTFVTLGCLPEEDHDYWMS